MMLFKLKKITIIKPYGLERWNYIKFAYMCIYNAIYSTLRNLVRVANNFATVAGQLEIFPKT